MIMQKEREKLQKYIKNRFAETDNDYQTYDIESKIDNKLTYNENFNIIKSELDILLKDKPKKRKDAEIMSKEEYSYKIQQQLSQFEKEADENLNLFLEKIEKDETTELIEKVYADIKHKTKMVAKKKIKGFLLYGEAGIGKSYSVKRAFLEIGEKFELFSGHLTTLEMYNKLFEYKDKNIIIDDVNILNDKKNLALLKACLCEPFDVQYNTTSSRLKAPNKFTFMGTICIILNQLPKDNEDLKAVMDRIPSLNFELNYKTKMGVIFELAKQEKEEFELNYEQRLEVARWLRENTSEATKNLSLRLLYLCFAFYDYFKGDEYWKRLAKKQIQEDEYMSLIIQGYSEQQFIQETGLSRRTFYRYKSKLVPKCHDFE